MAFKFTSNLQQMVSWCCWCRLSRRCCALLLTKLMRMDWFPFPISNCLWLLLSCLWLACNDSRGSFCLLGVIMSMVCSTKVLCPQNLFLRKLHRYKGRMSRYVGIWHLCFWHRHVLLRKITIFCNDVNKTSTSFDLLAINSLCFMSKK